MKNPRKRILKLLRGEISFSQAALYLKIKLGFRTETAERFDETYSRSKDPWLYETSEYEKKKYEETLKLLERPNYDRVLEVASVSECLRRKWPRALDFYRRLIYPKWRLSGPEIVVSVSRIYNFRPAIY